MIDINKANGVMLGQMIGDALGGTLEFSSEGANWSRFPNGLKEIIGKGPHRLIPGQITDDTELALGLARTLVEHGFNIDKIAEAYVRWKKSGPFDCGGTCGNAFGGWGKTTPKASDLKARAKHRYDSQANGALMRIAPLAIYGHAMTGYPDFADAVREDAALSHINDVNQTANEVFCFAIREGMKGNGPDVMLSVAIKVAQHRASRAPEVLKALEAAHEEHAYRSSPVGWCIKALHNAFHELLCHWEDGFEDSMVRTVMKGGDADTVGAITGALLGSYYGYSRIPRRWIDTVLNCKTNRPAEYQCGDALDLVFALIAKGERYHSGYPAWEKKES